MTLRVHTARVSYGGADRLDITRKSAPPEGIAFVPSWAICELVQRAAWARELGLDPRGVDLLALEPVAPQGAQRAA